jgi:hypothetical protein
MPSRPKPKGTKRGAWSAAEKEYVKANHDKVSVEEMAAHLNRDVATLKRYVEANHTGKHAKKRAARAEASEDLRESRAWRKLKDEFTEEELAYFEEEYTDLYQQFQCEVFKTEEQQIRKAITLDILMRRNLAARKKLLADIDRMDDWQRKASQDYKRDKDRLDADDRQRREEFLLNLETQLQSLRAAEQSKTKEFSDLDTRHQKLMEALKATREQRIDRVQSSKQSWLGLLRDLAEEDRARQEGRLMTLMEEATGREHKRLARPHVYDDGTVDQPILSADTVGQNEDEGEAAEQGDGEEE